MGTKARFCSLLYLAPTGSVYLRPGVAPRMRIGVEDTTSAYQSPSLATQLTWLAFSLSSFVAAALAQQVHDVCGH